MIVGSFLRVYSSAERRRGENLDPEQGALTSDITVFGMIYTWQKIK